MAATATTQIIVKAVDQFTGKLKAMESSLDKFSSHLDKTAEHSRKIGIFMGAVATAAGGLGYAMISAAADTEETMIAFETMLGSADKAKSFYEDFVNFASRTPFELKGLEDSSKQLLAYGFEQDEILPNLKALGDIASGVGMDKLPNLTLAFGQVKAATKLTGMELRQFTEAGVPLLDELAKQMGVSAGEVQEMVSAGQIGFPQVQQALQALTQDGGRFNNLMDKQADSLNGMISNLKDAWDVFLRGEGQALLDWAKGFVRFAIDIVQNHLPAWIEKIKALTAWFSEHQGVLIIVSGAIIGLLVPAILSAAASFAALAISMAPFLLGGAIIGAIVAGIVWIVKNWDMIKAKGAEVWDALTSKIGGAIDAMYDKIKSVWTAISDFFTGIWEAIKAAFQWYISFILGLVITIFDLMGIDIIGIFTAIRDFFVMFWAEVKTLFSGYMTSISESWQIVWTAISNFFSEKWSEVKTKVSSGLAWMAEKFKSGTEPIREAWGTFWEAVGNLTNMAWEGIKNMVKSGINWIIDKINWFIRKANEIAQKGAGALGISIPVLSEIPKLADGGIVTQPTIAEIGEAGPEAIVPLKKGYGGLGTTINITLKDNMLLDRDAGRMVGKQIVEELKLSNLLSSAV